MSGYRNYYVYMGRLHNIAMEFLYKHNGKQAIITLSVGKSFIIYVLYIGT